MNSTIKESFDKQGFMRFIGAELMHVEKGMVTIKCPYGGHLTQQDGFFHAGVVTSIVDVACGYAALTLMPEESRVLSVEFKTNFIRPAIGSYLIATGRVIKSGKTLTVCEGAVTNENEDQILAKMMATMICIK